MIITQCYSGHNSVCHHSPLPSNSTLYNHPQSRIKQSSTKTHKRTTNSLL